MSKKTTTWLLIGGGGIIVVLFLVSRSQGSGNTLQNYENTGSATIYNPGSLAGLMGSTTGIQPGQTDTITLGNKSYSLSQNGTVLSANSTLGNNGAAVSA